jgi:hypothetical protein
VRRETLSVAMLIVGLVAMTLVYLAAAAAILVLLV